MRDPNNPMYSFSFVELANYELESSYIGSVLIYFSPQLAAKYCSWKVRKKLKKYMVDRKKRKESGILVESSASLD